jgi:hypothetical protein
MRDEKARREAGFSSRAVAALFDQAALGRWPLASATMAAKAAGS